MDTPSNQEKTIEFYINELGKNGWKPTTDKVIRIGFHDHLIFRNPEKELIDLEIYEVEGVTRVTLEHDSAEEVERKDAEAKKMAANAKKKMEDAKILPKVTIYIPQEFKFKETKKGTLEFAVKPGTARCR